MALLPWYGNNSYLTELADSLGIFGNSPNQFNRTPEDLNEIPTSLFKVPIQFWIHRNDNASFNGISEKDMDEQLDILNEHFGNNNTFILFYKTCDVKYVDNSEYDFVEDHEIDKVIKDNYVDGVINVHYVVDAGFAGVFRNGISKDGIIMNFSGMSTSTLAHEVGHYFGLAHTHRNSDSDSECKRESVSRTREIKLPCCISNCINCEKKGDALCDTPADPNLNDGSFTMCNYSDITATDLWGDFYSTNPPDTRNIMSYMNPRVCRDNFTNNQILAMIDKLLKRGYGHDNEDPIEKYFFDKYEPDNNAVRAKSIYRNIKQHHTSHWSRINDNEVNACDLDWFIFTVALEDEGIPLLIETSAGIFNDANTEVFVYLNGFGSSSQVGFDFNTENYSNVVLNYPLPGIYYIEVRFINEPPANSILDYNIELSECTLSKPCVNGIVKSGETKYFYGVEAVTIPCRGGSFLVEAGGKAIIISEQLVNLREDIIVEDGGIIESVIMEIENPCRE